MADLDFAYNGQRVLENVSWSVGEGDFVAMLGPNDGGKTTLLKLILGLLKPDRGTVTVMGAQGKICPVELITHGHLPHRVLGRHEE